MKVHVLATCRRPELIEAALLFFRTIRTAFEKSNIHVWGNALPPEASYIVQKNCELRRCHYFNLPHLSHDRFIEELIFNEASPFWISDTDVIYWKSLEGLDFGNAMFAGRYEPEFHEEYYNAVRVPRLHTCVMWINPVALRIGIRAFLGKLPPPFGATMQVPLVRQTIIPRLEQLPLFYDTMAGLFQAGMGTAFTQEQDACFDHLHAATYVDLLSPRLAGSAGHPIGLAAAQQAVYADHWLAKGIKSVQDKYFASRAIKMAGSEEPAPHRTLADQALPRHTQPQPTIPLHAQGIEVDHTQS